MTGPGDLSPKEAAFGHVGHRRSAVDADDEDDAVYCVECGKDLTDPKNCGDPDVDGDWVCADAHCRSMHEAEMTVQRRVIRDD